MGTTSLAVGRRLVGALTLLLVVGLLTPAQVARAGADTSLVAAVVAGDCAEPGDEVAALRDLGTRNGSTAQTSFTTVDHRLDELTVGGYAIVVTGGDTPVACGDIVADGSGRGDVFLVLREENGSGYGGIGWLHADGERTRVSLFVAAGLGAAAGPPEPPEPEQETGGEPEAAPVFRGNPAHTGAQPGPGPKGNLALLWQRDLPGGEKAKSPSLSDGVLYVGADDGLYAVDAATGIDVWVYKTESKVTGAPAVADRVVYFMTLDATVYAVGADDGGLRWTARSEDGFGSSSSTPTVVDGVVYVAGGAGILLALDAATGAELWRGNAGTDDAAPTVVGGVVYLAGFRREDDYVVMALDAKSGQELWRLPIGRSASSPPAVSGGIVYVGGEDGVLYAVDADNGALVWQFAGIPVSPGGEMPAPAVMDGIVYYGSFDGTLFALDAATGEVRWQAAFGPGGMTRYPVVAGGEVYGIAGTTLFVLDAATGEERNRLEFLGLELSPSNFPGNVVSSPLVVDGVVYVGTPKGLLAIGGSE